MAVTFVLEGASHDTIDVGTSPLAELTATLHSLADSSHHQPGVPALERISEASSEGLRREIRSLGALWSGYRARFLFPSQAGLDRTLAEEVTLLDSYPVELFFESAAWAVRGGYSGCPPLEEIVSSPRARDDLLARARVRSSDAHVLMRELLDDPERVRGRIVDCLASCESQFFALEWRRVERVLTEDAASRLTLARRAGPVATIASLTRGAEVLASPTRVRFEKVHHGHISVTDQRILLVPSVMGWPHLLVKHEPGWPPVVHFPLRDASTAADPPHMSDVRHRLEALTEPTRLRICRLVAQSPSTTSDLAARTGMTAPQVSRHLRVLREADLVERTRDGRRVRYQIRQEQIARLGIDLLAALLR